MASRRTVLICGGAAVVITGAGAWGLTRSPNKARAPWAAAVEGFGDPLLDCLAFALLAPSPHNMQSWRIHRIDETSFELYPDTERLLPETDPPSRQLTIGFGCFLELFRQAAASKGWRADIAPFPQGSDPLGLDGGKPIAAVRIEQDRAVEQDPLFEHVLQRRTNRAEYDLSQNVSDGDLATISQSAVVTDHVGYANDASMVETLRSLTADAWAVEWNTAGPRKESIDVTRIGKHEINENPWGLSLMGPIMEALNAVGLLTRDNMDVLGTSAYSGSLDFYAKACRSAAAFLWLTTPGNDRFQQLEAGRSWVRMHLKATALGLAFHPLSQALQEFPEMADHYKRAHDLLAPSGGTVQMLVRLGYAESPPPSPRERLEAKLVEL